MKIGGIRRPGRDYEEMPGANIPVTQQQERVPSPQEFEMVASVSVVPDGIEN